MLNPALLFAAAYLLLGLDYHLWRGALAFGVAVACAAARSSSSAGGRTTRPAVSLDRRRPDLPDSHGAVADWCNGDRPRVGRAVLGADGIRPLLAWPRNASRPYQVFGAVLLLFALVRLLTANDFYVAPGRFIPLLNAYTAAGADGRQPFRGGFPDAAVRRLAKGGGPQHPLRRCLIGFVLIWLLLSREVYDFCTRIVYPSAEPWGSIQGQRASQTAFPVAWAAMGLALGGTACAAAARCLTACSPPCFYRRPLVPTDRSGFFRRPRTIHSCRECFHGRRRPHGRMPLWDRLCCRCYSGRLEEGDRGVRYGAGLIGVALVWLFLGLPPDLLFLHSESLSQR